MRPTMRPTKQPCAQQRAIARGHGRVLSLGSITSPDSPHSAEAILEASIVSSDCGRGEEEMRPQKRAALNSTFKMELLHTKHRYSCRASVVRIQPHSNCGA
jgi:hypothetical protein